MVFLLPVFVLRLYWRSIKAPAYRQRIGERFALTPKRESDTQLVWVHAVSVGETIAAIPMIKSLQQRYPQIEICITTTTPTGSDRVKAVFADSVHHYYLPYDVPLLFNLFFYALKPNLLIVMETELWPNMVAACQKKSVPVVLVNGRMSSRSARGYQRFSALTKSMLQQLDLLFVQSEADAKRFVQLGALQEKVVVSGSIKFDITIDESVRARTKELKEQLGIDGRKIVIFSSTHKGEDELLIPIIENIHQLDQSFLALIVPRHPERFSAVAELAAKQGLNFINVNDNIACATDTQLIIGDTMGDMLAYYGLADIAFIGGSLIRHGGHNFIEAAAWGLPILSGLHVFNFQTIADELVNAQALKLVTVEQLEQQLLDYVNKSEDYSAMGNGAKKVFQKNQGVLGRVLDYLERYITIS